MLSGGNLVITAIVRTDNPRKLTVVGQAVTDLANYASGSSIVTVLGSAVGVDQTSVPSGCQRQTFTVAQGVDVKKFLRLSATLVP
jgi:predicted Rossmann fold nucleotide-binding protein DprA/Smf involved in DNA uptake